MNPCTNALYVSLIRRCDSAAIVSKTSELLPEPDTPVNTVSRRFGISTLTSLRLFTRAPCTRIRSWRSAGASVFVLVALLIVSPCSLVLDQSQHVAVGIGEGRDQPAPADVTRRVLHGGPGGRHLGQLGLDVAHVPMGHRRRHALLPPARDQPDLLAGDLEADIVRGVAGG